MVGVVLNRRVLILLSLLRHLRLDPILFIYGVF